MVDMLRYSFFFFNDTATTEIYTLSLHDALPIYGVDPLAALAPQLQLRVDQRRLLGTPEQLVAEVVDAGIGERDADRKSTRLNSSHANISYAVFCLKKNNETLTSSAAVTRALISP